MRHPLKALFVACLVLLAAALALAATPSAVASDAFADVPNGAPFHDEISIFKTTNITTGCTATTFCPADFVKRQAMAAFIDRALGLVIRPGESTYSGIPGSRVRILDDDVSFIGTVLDKLTLSNNGTPVLRLEGNAASPNVIGGFQGNSVGTGVVGATIAGGGQFAAANSVSGSYGAIGGGQKNTVNVSSTVSGGESNAAGGGWASIAGGKSNSAGDYGAVGGGSSNVATGYASTVAGGDQNTAAGYYSFAAGGTRNSASGDFSFAAGDAAKAAHSGSFVWADASGPDLGSTGTNAFTARAVGGFYLRTNTALTTGCDLGAGSGSWSCVSDRHVKEGFRPVDGNALLRRLARIPISSWNYKSQRRSIRHIGPMAQDFAAAFGVGEDNRHISMVDADGVSLAAIQALYRRQNTDVRSLRAENAALRARLTALERAMARSTRKETGR